MVKNFNKLVFVIATVIFVILLFFSFFAAWAEDDGALPNSLFWIIFAKLFYILRFPTHTLFWSIIIHLGGIVFFAGLLINCLFYGFLTERVFYFIKKVTFCAI